MKKNKEYNVTEMSSFDMLEKNIQHRDSVAGHIFRWSFAIKNMKIGMKVLDFGSGVNNGLLELAYRNRYKLEKYLGLDIRTTKRPDLFEKIPWAESRVEDLVNMKRNYGTDWDMIVSFEVLEHVNKKNVRKFLSNLKSHCNVKTIVLLSTPNYDPTVGAADNHTYDGEIHEWDYFDLNKVISEYFSIKDVFGTFASQKDYKSSLSEDEMSIFSRLHKYYDSNALSNIMAPLVHPSRTRNTVRVLSI